MRDQRPGPEHHELALIDSELRADGAPVRGLEEMLGGADRHDRRVPAIAAPDELDLILREDDDRIRPASIVEVRPAERRTYEPPAPAGVVDDRPPRIDRALPRHLVVARPNERDLQAPGG